MILAAIAFALSTDYGVFLLGRANWWAPAPLRRLHERTGLGEADTTPPPGPAPDGPTRTRLPTETT